MQFNIVVVAGLVPVLMQPAPSFAATVEWIRDRTLSWNTATNWSTGTVPASADDVVINWNQSIAMGGPQVDIANVTVKTLTVGGTASNGGMSFGSAARSFRVSGVTTINGGPVQSMITVSNSGTVFQYDGDIRISNVPQTGISTAYMEISNGAKLQHGTSGAAIVLGLVANSTGSLNIQGAGTTATTEEIIVGGGGAAQLAVFSGGSLTSAGPVYISYTSGANGRVFVDGANSIWTASDNIFVGYEAAGVALVSEDGTIRVTGSGKKIIVGNKAGVGGRLMVGAEAGNTAVAPGTIDAEVHFGPGTGILGFNHTDTNYQFSSLVSGTGGITNYAGTTVLTAANTYSGATTVSGGTLYINGDQTAATGLVSVSGGAALGGGGTVGGSVSVAANGTLVSHMSGSTGRALTIKGNLTAQDAILHYDYGSTGGSAATNALAVQVDGDVDVSNSTITIASDSPLAAGTYHLVHFNGTATATGLALDDDNGGTLTLKTTNSSDPTDPDVIEIISTAGKVLRFWDATGHNNNAVDGGTGTWEAGGSSDNWTEDDGAHNGAYSDDSFAVFEGTAGTVTVDNTNGAITVTGMQFAVDGYTVQSGTITLDAGVNHFRVGDGSGSAAVTATISSILAGTGSLDKIDPGTLKLRGTNTYTGGSTVEAGILNIVSDASLGGASGGVSIGAGTLQFESAFTSARAISVTDNASIIDTQANDITLTGVISGTGHLNKHGSGTLTLTGTNTYSGGTTLAAGTLSVSSDANLGATSGALTISSGTLSVTADATLGRPIVLATSGSIIDIQSHDVTLAGTISGAGALNQHGSGILTLTGTNTYTGGTHVSGGTLIAASDASLGAASGKLTIDNATFKASGNITGTRPVELTSADSIVDTNGHDITFGGEVSGAGTLNKHGTGTLTLAGSNTFSGGASVSAGILAVSDDVNLGAAGGGLTLDGGTLQLNHDFSTGRQVELGTGGGVIDAQGFTGTFAGVIEGGGSLTTGGTGTTILSGANTYSGTTTVLSGELQIDGDQSAATGTVTVKDGASLSGMGTTGGSVAIDPAGKLRSFVDDAMASHALNILGDLNAAGATLEYDYGRDALHNTLTVNVGGDIDVSGTAINVLASAPMAAGVYHLVKYAGASTGSDPVLGAVPGAGFSLRTSQPNSIDLINTLDETLAFWNPVAAPDGIVHGGSGVWQAGNALSNWSDADGTIAGPYTDGAFAVFEGQAGVVTVDNGAGAVNITGMQFATDGYVVEGGAITLLAGDNDIRVGDGTDGATGTVATISAEITGAGRLNKTDAGILVLSGANTYTGGTSVEAGTLRVAADENLGAADGDIAIGNATLQYAGSFDTDRAVSVLSPNSTIDTQSNNAGLSGEISGAGGLIKKGDGVLALSGVNSFTGRTVIQEGTLALTGAGTLAASDGVTANAVFSIEGVDADETSIKDLSGPAAGKVLLGAKTLEISAGQGSEFAGEVSGAGGLHISGGTQVLSGANSYTGGTQIDEGAVLQIGTGGTTGSIEGLVDLMGTLDFNRSDDLTLSNQFTGTGTLNLNGAGTKTLATASPDFAGTTNLTEGQLIVDVVHGGGLNLYAGTTLSGTGTVGSTVNAGTIMPGTADTNGTLTIAGDYYGDSGELIIKTLLDGDGSATDLLHVTGNTSGSTSVQVLNRGGLGAQTVDGIRIVQVDGQSDGHFQLDGDYITKAGNSAVIAGIYAYTLNQGAVDGTGGDWYLRSESTEDAPATYNPGIPLYTSYGEILQNLNQGMITSLRERTGQRLGAPAVRAEGDAGSDAVNGGGVAWGRIDMAHRKFEPTGSTTANRYGQDVWKLSGGVDGQFIDDASGELFGSLWFDYVSGISRVQSVHGSGKIVTDGYGLGGALTWYDATGWYADAQAHATWYDSDFESSVTQSSPVSGDKAFGYGVSMEVGQDVAISESWSLSPQLQLSYSSVRQDAFVDAYEAAVSGDTSDSLTLRGGLAANYREQWKDGAGQTEAVDVYGIANVYRELLSQDYVVAISSEEFDAGRIDRTWLEIGAGGTYQWADSRFALFGNASVATGADNFGDNYRFGGKIGLKAKW